MSIPPNVGPNVALILQRLDLIEKKIDWVAERVTWLAYTAGSPEQAQGDRSTTTDSSPTTHAPMSAAESINVLDHRVSEPLSTTTSPAAATTTPAGTPATSAATELPTRLFSDSPTQAADEELPQHEVVSASAPAVLHDDAPRVPEVEEPVVQAPRSPAPVSPEHSSESWASPGSTGYIPAPSQRADTGDPYQGVPVGAGHGSGAEAAEIPGWAQRAVREGNLGRYLLSGAAALLVLSAGVSLLALVWDSIPNPVKILALALIAVTMTAVGARLSVSRPKYRRRARLRLHRGCGSSRRHARTGTRTCTHGRLGARAPGRVSSDAGAVHRDHLNHRRPGDYRLRIQPRDASGKHSDRHMADDQCLRHSPGPDLRGPVARDGADAVGRLVSGDIGGGNGGSTCLRTNQSDAACVRRWWHGDRPGSVPATGRPGNARRQTSVEHRYQDCGLGLGPGRPGPSDGVPEFADEADKP